MKYVVLTMKPTGPPKVPINVIVMSRPYFAATSQCNPLLTEYETKLIVSIVAEIADIPFPNFSYPFKYFAPVLPKVRDLRNFICFGRKCWNSHHECADL